MMFILNGVLLDIVFVYLVVVGWIGCDVVVIQYYIDELVVLGVKFLLIMFLFYCVVVLLLIIVVQIEVVGLNFLGEVELLILQVDGWCYFGLVFDYIDCVLEVYFVVMFKQVCVKFCVVELWLWEEVEFVLEDICL